MVNMTLVSLLRHMVLSRRNACLCTGSACLYGIPESTLRDRTLGLQPIPGSSDPLPRPGPQTLFYVTEGEQFVCHVKYMAEIGYGYSRREIVRLAISLAKKNNSEPCLSDYWFSRLKKRWRDIHVAKVASCQS
ncbi:hypothetical protein DPMN_082362 [Dreissena polymorpha]|uniref:HTH CENPB-type domain-containing protein n=1 Tax=Dreissena polymorpha TaxID=45954 RepID=A0A9D3YAG7_DREPO|nr:hypothetical protein DPMN_082362 [Dreissena polymorpha]